MAVGLLLALVLTGAGGAGTAADSLQQGHASGAAGYGPAKRRPGAASKAVRCCRGVYRMLQAFMQSQFWAYLSHAKTPMGLGKSIVRYGVVCV